VVDELSPDVNEWREVAFVVVAEVVFLLAGRGFGGGVDRVADRARARTILAGRRGDTISVLGRGASDELDSGAAPLGVQQVVSAPVERAKIDRHQAPLFEGFDTGWNEVGDDRGGRVRRDAVSSGRHRRTP
jgi:hypothetical protein